eukprot:CAMPEP_0197480660 /NCGR_PEP_ID=MMETSP1309-20131121/42473_1 /TAXON_ID=464262 /ORGANISM="Genus nov. species nov., Strain RCC998" /LENGTH=147 /DNA_ID=CAMNT_0043022677 /DNA_START=364 /DNA_END=803 /DNA_ORIENTATION=-
MVATLLCGILKEPVLLVKAIEALVSARASLRLDTTLILEREKFGDLVLSTASHLTSEESKLQRGVTRVKWDVSKQSHSLHTDPIFPGVFGATRTTLKFASARELLALVLFFLLSPPSLCPSTWNDETDSLLKSRWPGLLEDEHWKGG